MENISKNIKKKKENTDLFKILGGLFFYERTNSCNRQKKSE